MERKHWPVYLQLLLGMAFFGSATPVSKIVAEHFPVFLAGGFRVLLAALILLPFSGAHPQKLSRVSSENYLLLAGIALIGVVGFTAFLLYGMREVSGVAGSIIMSSSPAITAALSFLFFSDDYFNWRKGIAIILAMIGIVLINLGGEDTMGESSLWGVLFVLAAIFCNAAYTLFGKAATSQLSPVFVATASAIIAFVLFLPPALYQYRSGSLQNIPATAWWALAWYGMGTMGLGSLFWYRGVQKVKGSIAAGFMAVMPVSALLLSYALLGESFYWLHVPGFVIVFSSVLLIAREHAQHDEHGHH